MLYSFVVNFSFHWKKKDLSKKERGDPIPTIPTYSTHTHTPLFSSNDTYIQFCCICYTAWFSSFLNCTEEDRTQYINTVPMTLEMEPDTAFLSQWQSSHWLDETKLGLYGIHTTPTLNQQHNVIRRTSLTAFSKSVSNSSPRLMGNLRMAQSSLKNSGKLFQTPKSERALLASMSLSQFISIQMNLQCSLLSQPLPTKTNHLKLNRHIGNYVK